MLEKTQILFSDYPKIGKITKKQKIKNMHRIFTGGVRINNGMYRTDEQHDEYIKKSLRKVLP